MRAMQLLVSCECCFLLFAIWRHPSASVTITSVGRFMMSASWSAATSRYTDSDLIVLPFFMRIHSSGVSLLAFQLFLLFACKLSDGGAMMMLTHAVIRSGGAGLLSARKMSSYACPVFCMSHPCLCDSCCIVLGRLLLVLSIPGFSVLVLVFFVLERCAR